MSESEKVIRTMVEPFLEMSGRRGLKVNASKTKGMLQNREEGLKCEVLVNGMRLEYVSEFKYLGWVLDGAGSRYR